MKVSEVKNKIAAAGLAREIEGRALELLAGLSDGQEVSKEIMVDIVALVEVDIEADKLITESEQKLSDNLNEFLEETEKDIDDVIK